MQMETRRKVGWVFEHWPFRFCKVLARCLEAVGGGVSAFGRAFYQVWVFAGRLDAFWA